VKHAGRRAIYLLKGGRFYAGAQQVGVAISNWLSANSKFVADTLKFHLAFYSLSPIIYASIGYPTL
jgi:hypothetical protein